VRAAMATANVIPAGSPQDASTTDLLHTLRDETVPDATGGGGPEGSDRRGLSMDYEVFLVSRIYEEWRKRGDNREAVVHGLSATARTITAAAAIMVLVLRLRPRRRTRDIDVSTEAPADPRRLREAPARGSVRTGQMGCGFAPGRPREDGTSGCHR
jgi:hypothetical protein